MLQDLLFYTITALQGLCAYGVVMFATLFWKIMFYPENYQSPEKGSKSAFSGILLKLMFLILITTIKPYFLAMIGGA